MSEPKANKLKVENLTADIVAEMPPVSPQYRLKPAKPDADGKFRDANGNIFNPEIHAAGKNGVPIKTIRGFFKKKPGLDGKSNVPINLEKQDQEPGLSQDKIQTSENRIEDTPQEPLGEAKKKSENRNGSKSWFVLGLAGIGIALSIFGFIHYRRNRD